MHRQSFTAAAELRYPNKALESLQTEPYHTGPASERRSPTWMDADKASARALFWRASNSMALRSCIWAVCTGICIIFFAETGGKRRSWTAGTPSTASKLGENCPPNQMLIPITTDVPIYVFPSDAGIHFCS